LPGIGGKAARPKGGAEDFPDRVTGIVSVTLLLVL
jgi:hypothetical protein